MAEKPKWIGKKQKGSDSCKGEFQEGQMLKNKNKSKTLRAEDY